MKTPITTQAALLQALRRGPGCGTELIERVREVSSSTILLLDGGVYPALHSMEREGLVEGWRGDPRPGGGRPQHRYRLTTLGESRAAEQRAGLLGLLGISITPSAADAPTNNAPDPLPLEWRQP